MSDITICLLYYDEPEALSYHFEEMQLVIDEGLSYIIIDDGSSKFPIDIFLPKIPKEVLIYRINEDFPWNIPGARNLGALVSKTEWFIHLDCDLIFGREAIVQLKKVKPSKKKFYSFGRNGLKAGKPTAGTLLLNKTEFWASGGYNEFFRGSYGYNDPYLKYRLKKNGIKEVCLSDIVLEDRNAIASNKLERKWLLKNKVKYFCLRDLYWKFCSLKFAFSWQKIR